MGDYFHGDITIPKACLSTEVLQLIAFEGIDQDFEDYGCQVKYEDDQAVYGKFEVLEANLIKLQVPFDRHSNSYFENSAEDRYYRPAKENKEEIDVTVYLGDNDSPCIPTEKLRSLRKLSGKKVKDALKELLDCYDPYIEPLSEWAAGLKD